MCATLLFLIGFPLGVIVLFVLLAWVVPILALIFYPTKR